MHVSMAHGRLQPTDLRQVVRARTTKVVQPPPLQGTKVVQRRIAQRLATAERVRRVNRRLRRQIQWCKRTRAALTLRAPP